MTEVRDVIIIGSGPAGYTAALYAARARLNPLLFEGSVTSGGALMNTTDVENFPGFPDGVLGPDLMDAVRKQAERFGAELVPDDVTEVDLTASPKVIRVGGDTFLAKTVIIATGSSYRELGIPGEKRLSGRRRRRRLGAGGGHLPDPLRAYRHPDPPPRHAARFEDHAGSRAGEPQDPVRLGQRGDRGGGRGPGERAEAP